jgi:hypothetical protein
MLGGAVGPVTGAEVPGVLGGVVGPVTGADVPGVPAGEDAVELVEELQAVNRTATQARDAQDATRRDLRALAAWPPAAAGPAWPPAAAGVISMMSNPSINE